MSETNFVVVGDPHFGAKQNLRAVLTSQERFWYDVFIPYVAEERPTDIFILGDFFDNRTSIDVFIQNRAKALLGKLDVSGARIWMVLGNHDTYYKTSLIPNSIEPIVDGLKNVYPIIENQLVHVGNMAIALAPWIIDPTTIESIPDADILMAHLELYGFQAQPGYNATFGMDPGLFKRWKTVLSGHYHTEQFTGNINYVGAPYELTWHDSGVPKRFYHFKDGIMKSVDNTVSGRHVKVRYESADQWESPQLGEDWVKLFVEGEEDPKIVRRDIDRFVVDNPQLLSFEVIDNFQYAYGGVGVNVEELRVKDTLTIMKEYVDDLELPAGLKKKSITKYMGQLYNEALEQMKS